MLTSHYPAQFSITSVCFLKRQLLVGHLTQTHIEANRVMLRVCVCVCGKPPAQVQYRAIRDAPSASHRASKGFRQGGGG